MTGAPDTTEGPRVSGLRPSEVLRRATRYLEAHEVESARPTAEALLMHFLGVDRATLYTATDGLDTRTAKLFGRALCQRCSGTPLQYLTREQSFMGLSLEVGPGVFVPRPETERLVEVALEAIPSVEPSVVVDVGTGSGAIALAVKHARPLATVLATDVSEVAAAVATRNAERLGLDVDVRHGDLFDPLPDELRGRVDVVASNPPYVEEEEYASLPDEVRVEPVEALVGGPAVYERLVAEAARWLRPGGTLVVEIGAEQGAVVHEVFGGAFHDVEVLRDLAGRERIVRGVQPNAA